jgi:hypothetical protein
MIAESYQYERLSSREGFNTALLHFKAVSGMLGDFEKGTNLADMLNERIGEKELKPEQIPAIVKAVLVDKYGYMGRSINLDAPVEDFSDLSDEVRKWKAVDLVVMYLHPELGVTVINPKNPLHWEQVGKLKKDEIVTVYSGSFNGESKESVHETAIETLFALLSGKKKKVSATLSKGSFTYTPPKKEKPKKTAPKKPGRPPKTKKAAKPAGKAAPEKPAPKEEVLSTGAKKMTPMYSVPVTNELFHNGNVEAWKRIIQSFTAKHPDCEVYIFYEGERIHDINTLFKWGKVKHGSSILFAVVGEDIKDVAKLQRYLRQGASPRFEDFLRFPVNQIPPLF